MQSIVLCGGEGVRLRPLTYYFQKTMVPIGEKEKPLLEYVVRLLTHHGFQDIVLLINYRANQIVNYFNEGPRFNAKFEFIQDAGEIGGTGGALLNASEILQEDFVVYYGDILSAVDLGDMWSQHIEKKAACTVFVEKPKLHRPVSIGIFCLNRRAVDVIKEIATEKKKRGEKPNVDLPGDVIPALIAKGDTVKGYITDSFWYDVGSLERYEKLENHVVEKELSYLLK
jgi:mannose-1-phosphate guanylyltransferase